jgi:hypothetical protein
MITGPQIRAARGLLGWSAAELERSGELSRRIEETVTNA